MPTLIIHGGAGKARNNDGQEAVAQALSHIAQKTWDKILSGSSAIDASVSAARMLENQPLFNAGMGSKLQSDGVARLSAALMNGQTECFSGVINVEGILNPIELCLALQNERDRVLSGAGAFRRAQSLGLKEGDVRTKGAIAAWEAARDGQTGTIGAVVLDIHGQIAAATSTGGRGMEGVGRVSDSATVAGNFATNRAGVSCTGIGEDIVDGALAVRLVTAVESGVPLHTATEILQNKMQQHQWKAGLIALDKDGHWSTLHTTDVMYWHAVDHRGHHQFERMDRP